MRAMDNQQPQDPTDLHPISIQSRGATLIARLAKFSKFAQFQKDWFWVAVVFLLAVIVAEYKVSKWTEKPFFYQSFFEPAVMVACDRGFYANASGANAKLADFLNLKTDVFSCSDLPTTMQLTENFSGRGWYYMMHATGYLWKITGIQWKTLDRLVVFFYGLTSVFAFLIFRLWGTRFISFLASLFFMTSPLQLSYLNQFRDYSKIPFILATLWLLGLELKKQRPFRIRLFYSILAGAITGFGYGFRADLLVLVPFGFLLYLTLGRRNSKRPFLKVLILGCTFVASFIFVASPILNTGSKLGSCSWHFPLLGTADLFNAKLGLNQGSYGFIPEYNDRAAAFVAASYAERNLGYPQSTPLLMCSTTYDQITKQIMIDFMTTFPADFYRRFLAATPAVLTDVLMEKDSRVVWGAGLCAIVLFIFIAWLKSARMAIFFVVSTLYLCGYTFLQFQQRHFFYLEFIPWIAIVGVSSALFCWLKYSEEARKQFITTIELKRLLFLPIFLGILVLALWSIDFGLKSLQIETLTKHSAKLDSLEREPILTEIKESNLGLEIDISRMEKVFLPEWVTSDLLALSLNSPSCKGKVVNIKLLYNFTGASPNYDLSRSVKLYLSPGENFRNFYFPIYNQSDLEKKDVSFLGKVQIMGQSKDCFSGISKITDRSGVALWSDFSVPRPILKDDLAVSFYNYLPRLLEDNN